MATSMNAKQMGIFLVGLFSGTGIGYYKLNKNMKKNRQEVNDMMKITEKHVHQLVSTVNPKINKLEKEIKSLKSQTKEKEFTVAKLMDRISNLERMKTDISNQLLNLRTTYEEINSKDSEI